MSEFELHIMDKTIQEVGELKKKYSSEEFEKMLKEDEEKFEDLPKDKQTIIMNNHGKNDLRFMLVGSLDFLHLFFISTQQILIRLGLLLFPLFLLFSVLWLGFEFELLVPNENQFLFVLIVSKIQSIDYANYIFIYFIGLLGLSPLVDRLQRIIVYLSEKWNLPFPKYEELRFSIYGLYGFIVSYAVFAFSQDYMSAFFGALLYLVIMESIIVYKRRSYGWDWKENLFNKPQIKGEADKEAQMSDWTLTANTLKKGE